MDTNKDNEIKEEMNEEIKETVENEMDEAGQTSEAVISTEHGDIIIQKPKNSMYKKYVAVAIGVIAIVAIVAFFTMTSSKGGVLSNALATTFTQIENEGKKLDKYPNVLAYEGHDKDITERELSLLIENIDIGYNQYSGISNMLNIGYNQYSMIVNVISGLEFKTNIKSDIENDNFVYGIDILNEGKSLIDAIMYINSNNIKISSPTLFDGYLGDDMGISEESEMNFQTVKMTSEYNRNLQVGVTSVAEIGKNAFKEIESKITFEENKEESNEQSQVLYGEIEGNAVLEIYKKYFLEALKDENVKKMLESIYKQANSAGAMYTEELDIQAMEADITKSIDSIIAENIMENVIIHAVIDKQNKTLSNIAISTVIDGTEVKMGMVPEVRDKYVNIFTDFEISHEGESIKYNMNFLNQEVEKDIYAMNIDFEATLLEDSILNIKMTQNFNDIYKQYMANGSFQIDNDGNQILLNADVSGVYSDNEGSRMMEFDNITIDAYSDHELEFLLELSGYSKINKIDAMPEVKDEEVKMINSMSYEEQQEFLDQMLNNLLQSELVRYIVVKQIGL